MTSTTVTNFRKNLYGMVQQTIDYDDPLTISTKTGNAVLISENEYQAMIETLYLTSIPGMEASLLEAKNEPLSEGVNAREVQW